METVGHLLGDFAKAHPNLVVSVLGVVIFCVLVVNGIRMTWPVFAEMPRWARFILGVCDVPAGNFWNAVRKVEPEVSGPIKKTIGEPDE